MSEYRRFFSYIYAYEHGQKTSNAGFAKIQVNDTITTIELHMRGTCLSASSVCLYLFVRSGDSILGFPLGDVPFSNGNADRRFTLNQSHLEDSGYEIKDASGILFLSNSEICFVSQWDEGTIDWASFHIYKPSEETTESSESLSNHNVIQSAELPLPQQTRILFPVNANPEITVPHPQKAPEEVTHPSSNAASWNETWQQLLSARLPVHPFSNPEIRCVRAELKDLRLLPSVNWHLCNNSFLLHSFFIYRHLLIGELPSSREHKWFVGVPGIRYRQEHVLAAIFGFSDFLPDKESTDADAPFGYWYITITVSD